MNSRLITLLALCLSISVACKDAKSNKTNGDQQGKPDFKPAPVINPGNGNPGEEIPNFDEPITNPGNGNGNDGDSFDERRFNLCFKISNGREQLLNQCPVYNENFAAIDRNMCSRRDMSGRCIGAQVQCKVQFIREANAEFAFCQDPQGNNNGGVTGPGNPNPGRPVFGNPNPGRPVFGNPNPGRPVFGNPNPGRPGQWNPNRDPVVRYPNDSQGPGVIMPGVRQ